MFLQCIGTDAKHPFAVNSFQFNKDANMALFAFPLK